MPHWLFQHAQTIGTFFAELYWLFSRYTKPRGEGLVWLNLKPPYLMNKIIFDKSYFNGRRAEYSHNAGYSNYDLERNNVRKRVDKMFAGAYQKGNVLELGCAKGFAVERLMELGVEAKGVDISEFAISEAKEEIKKHLVLEEVISFLKSQPSNSYENIVSFWFIECLNDEELSELSKEANRVSNNQYHFTNSFCNKKYYNAKNPEEYKPFGFKNTIISNGDDRLNLKTN